MKIKLTDIRRYAIDRRVEITAIDSMSGHRCLINVRGQASIPAKDRLLRVEEIIDAADSFEVSGAGKAQSLSREEIARSMGEHFKSRGFSAVAKEEE